MRMRTNIATSLSVFFFITFYEKNYNMPLLSSSENIFRASISQTGFLPEFCFFKYFSSNFPQFPHNQLAKILILSLNLLLFCSNNPKNVLFHKMSAYYLQSHAACLAGMIEQGRHTKHKDQRATKTATQHSSVGAIDQTQRSKICI